MTGRVPYRCAVSTCRKVVRGSVWCKVTQRPYALIRRNGSVTRGTQTIIVPYCDDHEPKELA